MLANEKVVKFENENMKIMGHIQNFFNELNRKNRDYDHEKESIKTRQAYETDIRQYFRMMRDKPKGSELEFLSLQDIMISQDDFDAYIEALCDMKKDDGTNMYVNKTINRKCTPIKEMLKFLKRKKVLGDFDISYLQIMKGQKERKNHFGALEPEECLEMSRLAWEEREKGQIKKMLILTGFKTGLRIGELLNLKWDNFIKVNDEVFIEGIGKGNKLYKIKITNELYKELETINEGQERVFDITTNAVNKTMDRLKKIMKIDPKRQIVFHSIRKSFGTLIWRLFDIEHARRALRHESILTTQIYLGVDNYEINDIVFMVDKVNEDLYKKVNQDDLHQAISNCPKHVQMVLNLKLYELLKQKVR